jgi:hypothetical protein
MEAPCREKIRMGGQPGRKSSLFEDRSAVTMDFFATVHKLKRERGQIEQTDFEGFDRQYAFTEW